MLVRDAPPRKGRIDEAGVSESANGKVKKKTRAGKEGGIDANESELVPADSVDPFVPGYASATSLSPLKRGSTGAPSGVRQYLMSFSRP